MGAPLRDDRGDAFDHLDAGAVPAPERRKRQIRFQERDQIEPLLQLPVKTGELGRKPLPELPPHQATARDEDGQVVGRVEDVGFALLPPGPEIPPGLLLHEGRVRLQPLVPERREEEAQLLCHDLRARVVGDAAAEDRHGELIGLLRRELVVGRPEERRVRGRPGQDGHAPAGQENREDLTVALSPPAQEIHRTAVKLQGMADPRPASGEHRRSRLSQEFPSRGTKRTPPVWRPPPESA